MWTIFHGDKLMGVSREQLKRKVIPILALGFVIAISVVISILFYQGRLASIAELKYFEYYGYPGVFLVSMVWNSTVLVPIPSFWIYYPLGSVFFPPLLGLAGGAGAAIGELTAYMAGYSGRGIVRRWKLYTRVESWLEKWGFVVIFGFNLVPFFPFDLVGIAAGVLRFPLWKFYLACLAGRSLAYGFMAMAGAGWIQLPAWLPFPLLNPPQ
jgi:uncharacterized membrane protein YdjX (TVP38/TMEM64 family)